MNTRIFVGCSSLILATWLGATFFNEVPAQRYPKLAAKTVTVSTEEKPNLVLAIPVEAAQSH